MGRSLQTPNGIGSLLAFAQLILFVVLPRKPNQRAPILRLFDCMRRCGSNSVKDIESAAGTFPHLHVTLCPFVKTLSRLTVVVSVVTDEKDEEECKITKHRWSDRVIANVANVTGEIESVIQKVHHGDQ